MSYFFHQEILLLFFDSLTYCCTKTVDQTDYSRNNP